MLDSFCSACSVLVPPCAVSHSLRLLRSATQVSESGAAKKARDASAEAASADAADALTAAAARVGDVSAVEAAAVRVLVAVVLQLREKQLRALLLKLVDWLALPGGWAQWGPVSIFCELAKSLTLFFSVCVVCFVLLTSGCTLFLRGRRWGERCPGVGCTRPCRAVRTRIGGARLHVAGARRLELAVCMYRVRLKLTHASWLLTSC